MKKECLSNLSSGTPAMLRKASLGTLPEINNNSNNNNNNNLFLKHLSSDDLGT